jgi:hypothetical protein
MVLFSAPAIYSIIYVVMQIYFAEQYKTTLSSACHLQKQAAVM